jgi:hypothetical protein
MEFVNTKFEKTLDIQWDDTMIPSRFDMMPHGECLVTCITPSECAFSVAPTGRSFRIPISARFSRYSEVCMPFVSPTILVVSAPEVLLALVDFGGADLRFFHYSNPEILNFQTPPLLMPASTDCRVFFSPESLSFFALEYRLAAFMGEALRSTDDWRGIGHLAGGHQPFADEAAGVFWLAGQLDRPCQFFDFLCEFVVARLSLLAENKPLARFVNHEFAADAAPVTEKDARRAVKGQLQIGPAAKAWLRECDQVYSPLGFWRVSTLYRLVVHALLGGRLPRPAHVAIRPGGVTRRVDLDACARAFIQAEIDIFDFLSKKWAAHSDAPMARDSPVDFGDFVTAVVHFLVAKEFHHPFHFSKMRILQHIALMFFSETERLMLAKFGLFQFFDRSNLARPSDAVELWLRSTHASDICVDISGDAGETDAAEIFEPCTRLKERKWQILGRDYNVDNLIAIYGET